MTSKNSGCLFSILSLFRGKPAAPEALPYRRRDDFLSPAELSFYKVLVGVLGPQHVVQCKVRLADVFFVARPNENLSYFNKIVSKHIDFLVCDARAMNPLLGIELDDASHQRASRVERDVFVDEVFQAASLPLLRIPPRRAYNTAEVAALLAAHLQLTPIAPVAPVAAPAQAPAVSAPPAEPRPVPGPVNAAGPAAQPPAPGPHTPPVCPKCGLPMLLRTVARGEHQGKQFYGCVNYPRCRELKPYRP